MASMSPSSKGIMHRSTHMDAPLHMTEGCGVRVVAVLDPEQRFRIETGK